jgi:hypothetical protein
MLKKTPKERGETNMADLIELHWSGQYAQLVEQHPHITAWHEEGASHVIFPEGTRFEPDAKLAKRPGVKHATFDRNDAVGRYSLSDGSVFIFDGTSLYRFLLSF